MTRSGARRSGFAAITLSLLATIGLSMPVAPATAASGVLGYDCTSSGMPVGIFTAVMDTDAPATLLPAQTINPTMTVALTLPPSAADGLRGTGAPGLVGDIHLTTLVNGVTRPVTLPIPLAPIPPGAAGTPMTFVATGPLGSIGGLPDGTVLEIEARDFIFSIGFPGFLAGTVPCTVRPGQNLDVDTVAVDALDTTTTLTVDPLPVSYGETPMASADVTVTGSNAKPDGTVRFTFEGTAVEAVVTNGHATVTLAAAATIGLRTVSATFTPSDPTLATSQGTQDVSVVRDQTTTTGGLAYRESKNRLVAKVKVTAEHGTAVTGFARLVLKRNGVRYRVVIVPLNSLGKQRKSFSHIKTGKYLLVARYLGSPTLLRSADRAKRVV